MMDIERIIQKNGGDVQIRRDMDRVEKLPYLDRQHVFAGLGIAVLNDLVDGTEVTPSGIKKHFDRAKDEWLRRRGA